MPISAKLVDGVNPHDPWSSGLLKPALHDRLVASIDLVATRSGLGERYKHLIWTPTDSEITKAELGWAKEVASFRQTGGVWTLDKIGIVYPENTQHVAERMRHLVARLIRNFVDARIMTVQEVIAEQKSNGGVEGSAILIPDFLIPEYVSTMSEWDRRELTAFVRERIKAGLPTCVYAGVELYTLKGKFPTLRDDLIESFMTSGEKALA